MHPLLLQSFPLYFLLAALLTLATLLWQQRRAPYTCYAQVLFYAVFFGGTAALEPLRENYLTLNNWLAAAATAVTAGFLLGHAVAGNRTASSLAGAR